MNLQFSIELPYHIDREDDLYVSCCPILDVVSQGYSEEEAIKNLGEAVSLFIGTCFEMGTLDEVLKQCGFQPVTRLKRHSKKSWSTFNVAIPFSVPESKVCQHA